MKTSNSIISVKTIGSFINDQEFTFNSKLNTIIGPRGSGKTTFEELIRYGLKAFKEGSEREKQLNKLMDANLDGGRVEIKIQKDDQVYIISRTHKEEPIILDENGNHAGLNKNINDFFSIDIFSHNEIGEIAEKELEQLTLLDNFESKQITELNLEINTITKQLDENKENILRLISNTDEQNLEIQLEQINHNLEELKTDAGDNDHEISKITSNKAYREREVYLFNKLSEASQNLISELKPSITEYQSIIGTLQDDKLLKSKNAPLTKETLDDSNRCFNTVSKLINEAISVLNQKISNLDKSFNQLKEYHEQQELEDRKIIEQDDLAKQQAATRNNLIKEKARLEDKIRETQDKETRITELTKERNQLKEELISLRNKRFDIRDNIARMINDKLESIIQIDFSQDKNTDNYNKSLQQLLKDNKIRYKKISEEISNHIPPMELFRIVSENNTEELQEYTNLNTNQAIKVIDILSEPEKLYSIDIIETNDLPTIYLIDNGILKKSSELSQGQKSNAILPILLLYKDCPIAIDQPEDNLHPDLICNHIVKILKEIKLKRQFLIITHNANIPVLGESEKVFVMESNGQRAIIKKEGSVDDCREEIVTLLEGGTQAFKKRQETYQL